MTMDNSLQHFALSDILTMEQSENNLTKLVINNAFAEAEIYLQGAHLTHFQPHGEEALIFDGKNSVVTPPQSVHAGIPICWPWFGPHPSDATKPQHGFARDVLWDLKSTKALSSGETEVVLNMGNTTKSHHLFPYAFNVEVTFTIGHTLQIALTTTNLDTCAFTITQALHSYFAISDLDAVQIEGVTNTSFVDYTDEKKEKSEVHLLKIEQEVNRVYLPTQSTCVIKDSALKRKIVVEKEGSNSTTIWNPWSESGIHDLPNTAYRCFVCIETTNALSDAKTIAPQQSHCIKQIISVNTLEV